MKDDILEYSASFKKFFESFVDGCEKKFSKWTKDSKIDVEENKKTVEKFHKTENEIENLERKLSSKRALKGFLIFLIVCLFITGAVFGYIVYQNFYSQWYYIFAIVGSVGLAIFLIVICATKIKKAIDSFSETKEEKIKLRDNLKKQAYNQLKPLFEFYDDEATMEIINNTIPIIKLDPNFNMKRYDILHNKYNLPDNLDEHESTIGVLSGEILGNPFIEEVRLVQSMGMKTYTGSMTIYWTEYIRDSKGNTTTVHRSEVLYASVDKPAPEYSKYTQLIFANDVAPKLTFSRSAGHNHTLTERELKRKIIKGEKQLKKMEKQALKENDDFTSLINVEFEILFNALNRNDDTQYRLLFTPLAQKNMLHLLKTAEPFGDDFYFEKDGYLNYIISEHAQSWDLDVDSSNYIDFDYEICKENFMNFNESYFTNLYFEFAPLLSIPLYQMHKSLNYIYKKTYERNITSYETDVLANALNPKYLQHKDSATELILKTELISKNKKEDSINISAHSFKEVHKVEYVTMLGGDGKFHDVPVPYIEYVPVVKNTIARLNEVDNNINENKDNEAYKHRIHISV